MIYYCDCSPWARPPQCSRGASAYSITVSRRLPEPLHQPLQPAPTPSGVRPQPLRTARDWHGRQRIRQPLRSKVNKNVVCGCSYADNQVDVGASDMSAHIQSMASCPGHRGGCLGARTSPTWYTHLVPTQNVGASQSLPPGSIGAHRRGRAVRQWQSVVLYHLQPPTTIGPSRICVTATTRLPPAI